MSNAHPAGTDLAQPVAATDHILGPEHAPVVLVEYGDYQCPTCKQAAPTVKLLLEHFTNRVRFVYRHFPLEQAHPFALSAAEAAECAGEQGRFWQMHDLLFEHQDRLMPKHLRSYAERIGLDLARYVAEMDDHVYLQRIREHQEGGRRSHVRGTPGFYVNGRIFDVSFGLRGLFDAVSARLGTHR
ncbi:MAG: thioredoxin domain-containing protein [Proteobacteria bacterium]|nr:thioredoxin domain-containing protein [Pseudomonadota bacterium]